MHINNEDIYIVEGARTPFGKFLGSLKGFTPTELATFAAQGALERAKIAPQMIDSVIIGNVLQASNDAVYLPRHVALNVGATSDSDALIVSRACGSAIEAVVQATKALRFGEAEWILAGGTENMSMIPYVMRGVREGWRMAQSQVEDYLFCALYDAKAGCQIGETVEKLAQKFSISREQADLFALVGQARTKAALESGKLAAEITPVTRTDKKGNLTQILLDENPRPELTEQKLASLPGLYHPQGVVTAGNSCGLADGAAMLVISTGAQIQQQGLKPLGRIVSWASAGVPPLDMGIGPVKAARKALQKAGLTLEQMDLVELNDSFSVQAIAVTRLLDLDEDKVNPNAGSIALGHPMGATGTRLILSALYELRRTGKRYALCTVCIGGGQGIAIVLEHSP